MTAEQRREELKKLEELCGNRVIAYLTGDRGGAETRIGMDVFPYFYELLNRIGKVKQIDVLLYSTGGLTMAAWGLANLIREYCDRFSVLVPFKAHGNAPSPRCRRDCNGAAGAVESSRSYDHQPL